MGESLYERMKRVQEREDKDTGGKFDRNAKIFKNIEDGVSHLRLVGFWTEIKRHSIGPSKFSPVSLYEEKEFTGEEALRKQPTCADWNPDTEMAVEEKTCVLCRLHSAASKLLFEGEDMDEQQKDYLKAIRKATGTKSHHYFLCIDRDNPEIAPGRKGFKIVDFPSGKGGLWEKFSQLVNQYPAISITDADEGIDLVVSRKKGADNKYEYGLNFDMDGITAKKTPLTEEEKAYEKPDIKTIFGKTVPAQVLYDRLKPEFKSMLDNAGFKLAEANESTEPVEAEQPPEDMDENVPF